MLERVCWCLTLYVLLHVAILHFVYTLELLEPHNVPSPGTLPAVNRELVRFSRPSPSVSSRLTRPHGIRQQGIHVGHVYGQARDWDIVRPLCSAGSSPKTCRSRAGLPSSAGRSSLSLLLLLLLLVRLPSLLQLLILCHRNWPLRGKSMVPGGCLPHPRSPGSRFCRRLLERYGWHRRLHLRHVIGVGLAIQVLHPPFTLT